MDLFFDHAALLLNTLSLGSVAFFVGIGASSLIVLPKRYWYSLAPARKTQFLWLTVSMPWALAIASPVFVGFSIDTFYPSLANLMHWHHSDVFILNSWHIYPAILLLVVFSFTLVKSGVLAARHVKNFNAICSFPDSEGILDVKEPNAFSAGLLKPKTFITKGLVNELETSELKIVQLHELSHVINKDSLQKLIFGFMSSFFPRGVSKTLQHEMALSIELKADSFVVLNGISKLDVAATLLKVTKIINAYERNPNEGSLQCGFSSNQVKVRIENLLTQQPAGSIPDYSLYGSLLVISLFCLFSLDTLHHVIETFFNH
jgi:Zn-dependent protease with chaperone function